MPGLAIVLVNGRDVRSLQGCNTPLAPDSRHHAYFRRSRGG